MRHGVSLERVLSAVDGPLKEAIQQDCLVGDGE